MKLLSTLHKASQQSKIFRYKTYKKIGGVGHRKSIDRIFMGSMVGLLVIGAFFIIKPDSESIEPFDPLNCAPNCPIEPIENPAAQEVVHSDLGDAPVIEEESTEPSLADLENLVAQNIAQIKTHTLKSGESLAKLLARINLDKQNQSGTLKALDTIVNLKTIKSGTPVIIFLTVQDNSFLGLSIPLKENEFVGVLKTSDTEFIPISQEGTVETKQVHVKGKIIRTFSGSAQKVGIPQLIVNQILNALGDEIDLRSGFKKDDEFEVIYSQKVTSGGLELDIDKQCLFVGLKMGKDEVYRYLYTDKSGTPAFYNPMGQRDQRTIIKRPLKAVPRLSSPYGWRIHPVLMYRVFHSGVDLASPRGTPIMAGADGKIVHLGRKGAYGKYIKIQHAGGWATAYGHMNGYKSGLKVGSRVKQGDIIGYVGATGRATGPHLHYEVWKNGKTVNPFNKNVISGKQLTGFELAQFQSYAESINPEFQKHLFGKYPPIPVIKPQKNTAKKKK
mgnify:CR=1 FL=1